MVLKVQKSTPYEQNMNKSNDKNYTAPIYFLAGKKSTLIPPSYKNRDRIHLSP